MPLQCISLLFLLLLPLSRSKTLGDFRQDYYSVVEIDLNATREHPDWKNMTSCNKTINKCSSEHTASMNATSVQQYTVRRIHELTCRMKYLGLNVTQGLVETILHSLDCVCPAKRTKKGQSLKTHAPKGQFKRAKRERQHLCRAHAMLSSIIECYQILNSSGAESEGVVSLWENKPINTMLSCNFTHNV